jgi:TRAP transporter TAXI family solute receptor
MFKKIALITAIVAGLLSAHSTPCSPKLMTFMKIATGSKSGTYIKIGEDLSRFVAPDSCVKLEAIPTKGSVQNVMMLLKTKYVALAIVQSDVLGKFKEMASLGNRKARVIVDRLRLVKPLYTEEAHFIVRRDSLLKKIQDIESAKINIGPNGSGTAMSSILIYKELFGHNIPKGNSFSYGYDEALKRLLRGEIDVVVMVGGQPLNRLSKLSESAKSSIKLLSYDTKAPQQVESYSITKLLKSNYRWLDSDVTTIGVPSYLVTFNYGRSPNRYQIKMSRALARMAFNLHKNMPLLKKYGHKKWQEVSDTLQTPLRGWRYYDITNFAYNYSGDVCTPTARDLTLCR